MHSLLIKATVCGNSELLLALATQKVLKHASSGIMGINANPLAKIPCLIFDDNCALFDREVIIRYLDEKHGKNKLFGEKLDWQRAANFSMVKGLVDSTVGLRQEQMREEEGVRSPFWTERF
ncbi:glutathione S-transferase [Shewanella sp. 202IG2-18]|uniref:glutathione S-transferase family protein n=1 Tax=Parashewanella hymeniacidonis TaxID=2807618 RepID=UPI0019605FF3|nr:glutathione S-transferase family protein [Parashewanella hymeniacidonis]MBM7072836.1 glutathione S-transferase [Parashewanella hymeniacidonis]